MGLQPSASRTALLLACPRPFDPEIATPSDEPGEPARYGSAFHAILAACLKSKTPLEKDAGRYAKEVEKAARWYDVDAATAELAGHVKSSVKVLRNWLTREKLEVAQVEVAYAVHPEASGHCGYRPIEAHDEDHRYDCAPDELPGTIDLIARDEGRRRHVVIDHKTGSGDEDRFAQPASIPQMRTLGLVKGGVTREIEVGIFHADRRGLPNMYVEEYDDAERAAHATRLHRSLAMVGEGFLRAGSHCGRCPVHATCPAHAANLLSDGAGAIVQAGVTLAAEPIDPSRFGLLMAPENGLSVEERAGALHELLRKLRKLDEAGTAEIKRLVKAGAVIETRDGKTLALREDRYETLSKKSIVEALGKLAGEKELARLRKKGVMRETRREQLVAEK